MKKTWLALALGASVLATSVAAPAQADTLRVGTHPTFAPFEFTDNDGNIIGFDLDIIKAIAKVNGDEVVVESMPFDGLIPSILTGNLDVIISGMTITDARKKRVEFSEGYYDSNLSIIIKKDMAETYKTADDLKGKTICVLELSNGGCEAVINDRPVNLYYLKKASLDTLTEFVDPKFKENVDEFGIAVRKGNTDLVNKINNGLKQLEASGELDQIHLKWFGTKADGSLPAAEAEAAPEAAPAGTVANVSEA